jgi:hypothetical protein
MKNKFLLIVFSFASIAAMAQSYSIFPSNTLHVSAVYNEENKFRIYFTNISDETITLQWKVISNNLVAGWDCYICDNVSCCKGVPQSGTLPYIDPGIDVFLALVVDPKAISGMGTLRVYVYEDQKPLEGDTLTWMVNSIPTGLNTLDMNSGINIFPNPASDYLMIDMNAYHSAQLNRVAIYNSTGQLLTEQQIRNTVEKLDITSLPKGLYCIVLHDANNHPIIKTVVK